MKQPSPPPAGGTDLVSKIARLVEERGWTQEDFARIADLNRHTVRKILKSDGGFRIRNDTVSSCAFALGLQVHELRNLPLERLLPRMRGQQPAGDASVQSLLDQAAQPELQAWLQRNPDRASRLSPDDVQELLSMQGRDGPLARIGVEHSVDLLERRRRLLDQVRSIAGTEYLGLLEQLVGLIYEKIKSSG